MRRRGGKRFMNRFSSHAMITYNIEREKRGWLGDKDGMGCGRRDECGLKDGWKERRGSARLGSAWLWGLLSGW